MTAGHRRAAKLKEKVAGPPFMVRIAGREMAGHGKGGYIAFGVADGGADGGLIKACLW